MPMIDLDLIDPPAENVRRIAASVVADGSLELSIAELGVLQPVLVMRNGGRFQLIDGERRVRIARKLGVPDIVARVISGELESYAPHWATAVGAAANIVREPMAPLDTWRVMARLQAQGYTLRGACSALGLSEREGRKLNRLSRLHPDILARLEQGDWPRDYELGVIANARPADQAHALKAHRIGKDNTAWHAVRAALERQHIPADWALFDLAASGITFEEDLFADPSEGPQLFTTDHAGFLVAQKEALEALLRNPPKGVTYAMAEPAQHGGIKLPKNAERVYVKGAHGAMIPCEWRKAKKGHTVLFELSKTGEVKDRVVKIVSAPAKAAKPATTPAAAEGHRETDPDEVPDAPDVSGETPSGISKAGLELIAAAKTEALRQTLETLGGALRPDIAVAGLVLLLTAPNVSIAGANRTELRALRDRLVTPFGALRLLDGEETCEIAGRALELCLKIPGPNAARTSWRTDTGEIGEWIGHAIRAGEALPRFDTETFLATLQRGPLQTLAQELGLKPGKTAAELRRQIAGHAPDWRPPQSQFGAAGPKVGDHG
jgi:ParB family chromosome partitioning protein